MKNNIKKEIISKNVISIFDYPQGEVFKIINENRKLLEFLEKKYGNYYKISLCQKLARKPRYFSYGISSSFKRRY